MTPTSEVGIILAAIIAIVGAFFMALIKMFERNGAVIKCSSCGCSCECDMRRHETRLEEARTTARASTEAIEI